jgi:hypothetical protein
MPCDKSALLDFLEVLNGDLTKKVTLVAAGGSARARANLQQLTLTLRFPAVTCLNSNEPSKTIRQASK